MKGEEVRNAFSKEKKKSEDIKAQKKEKIKKE